MSTIQAVKERILGARLLIDYLTNGAAAIYFTTCSELWYFEMD